MNATDARRELGGVAVELDKVRATLARIAEGLGDDATEKTRTEEVTPSVARFLRTAAETIGATYVAPAHDLLRAAAQVTHAEIREWRPTKDDADGVPGTETARVAARLLGDGDGMQKLWYVLHLARLDDTVAERVADMATFLVAAKLICAKPDTDDRTDDERIILLKAARLESARCRDEVDRAFLRRADMRRAVRKAPLSKLRDYLLRSLTKLVVVAKETVAFYAEVGLPDVPGVDSNTDAVDTLPDVESEDDGGPYVGRALRIAYELRGRT